MLGTSRTLEVSPNASSDSCAQKTPPPVLIFCENKGDVDDIHEYLLLKVRHGDDML